MIVWTVYSITEIDEIAFVMTIDIFFWEKLHP